jgi:hypothetical protein
MAFGTPTPPSDRIVAGYDMTALNEAVKKHLVNIKMFEDGIANEKVQMGALSAIITRKRELDKAGVGQRPPRG